MEVQKYLREKSLDDLNRELAITLKRHNDFPNLILFKYSQLDSPMSNPVVQECRGIILDESDNWRPVSYPFRKFFNYKEPNADKIDWESAHVFEKIDGSLLTLYHYDNKWHVASTGSPDASGMLENQRCSVAELFWEIWGELGYSFPKKTNMNYMFEMVSPEMRVLVPYEKGQIHLIGARNLDTLQEVDLDTVSNEDWVRVQKFPMRSLEEVLAKCNEVSPIEQEGFVVCDSKYNRIKIKSPQYVRLCLLNDADTKLTDRYLLEILQTNEEDEFLNYFEDHRERYLQIKERYNALISDLEALYKSVKDLNDRREIGLRTKDTVFPSMVFQILSGKHDSVKSFIRNVPPKHLIGLILECE